VHLIFQSPRLKILKFSNPKIRHDKLETFKLETPYPKIGQGKPKTLKQKTLDLEVRHGRPQILEIIHGRPKILQIKHPRLENWTS
jgi:hypothetical protein